MNSSKGHLLIVTRHFPPTVSGGARRPFLLASGLSERGWRVTVASPTAPNDFVDWIETPHPAGERGEEGASRMPSRFEKFKSNVRTLLYWPDNDIRWAFGAARAVLRSGLQPDWLLTTSPPESAHVAGALLHKKIGARWLAEMRDSWIDDPLRVELQFSSTRRVIERFIAQGLLKRADRVIAVTETIAREADRYRSDQIAPVDVVGHFAKPSNERFKFEGDGPHFLHSGRFSLSHAGREINPLLDAFSETIRKNSNARLHLVGLLTSAEKAHVDSYPYANQITIHGEVSHAQALAMQQGADALILYQSHTAALPGKLGEYLACTAPIFAFGDGAWRSNLKSVPHFEFSQTEEALSAPKRMAKDSLQAALDTYENVMSYRA